MMRMLISLILFNPALSVLATSVRKEKRSKRTGDIIIIYMGIKAGNKQN